MSTLASEHVARVLAPRNPHYWRPSDHPARDPDEPPQVCWLGRESQELWKGRGSSRARAILSLVKHFWPEAVTFELQAVSEAASAFAALVSTRKVVRFRRCTRATDTSSATPPSSSQAQLTFFPSIPRACVSEAVQTRGAQLVRSRSLLPRCQTTAFTTATPSFFSSLASLPMALSSMRYGQLRRCVVTWTVP